MLTVSLRGRGTPRPRRPAYATWALVALTVAIFLIQAAASGHAWSELLLRYGVMPEIFSGGERPFGDFPPWLTPLTAMFLHGGWDHLLANMIYLFVFGDEIEEVLGALRFVLFYLVCGVCGALGYVAMDNHATIVLIGAQGCVSGVLAAYLMLRPCEPVAITLRGLDVRFATYWAIGSWILLQLFQFLWHGEEAGFTTLSQAGGAIGGAFAFWLLCPRGIELFQCLPARNDRSGDAS